MFLNWIIYVYPNQISVIIYLMHSANLADTSIPLYKEAGRLIYMISKNDITILKWTPNKCDVCLLIDTDSMNAKQLSS